MDKVTKRTWLDDIYQGCAHYTTNATALIKSIIAEQTRRTTCRYGWELEDINTSADLSDPEATRLTTRMEFTGYVLDAPTRTVVELTY